MTLNNRIFLKQHIARKAVTNLYRNIDNIPILVFYLLLSLVALAVSIYGFLHCNPWPSYSGADSWGNLCSSFAQDLKPVENVSGSGKIIHDRELVWAVNFYTTSMNCLPDKDKLKSEKFIKICVKSCPNSHLNSSAAKTCQEILEENQYSSEEFKYAVDECQTRQPTIDACSVNQTNNSTR